MVTVITPTFLPFEIIYVPGLAPQPADLITVEDFFKAGGIRHIPPPLGMTQRKDGRSRLLYGFERESEAGRRSRADIEARVKELESERDAIRAKLDKLREDAVVQAY